MSATVRAAPHAGNRSEDARQRAIAAALARDVDGSFERLVQAYQHRVYGFVLQLIADSREAEEIAQETFVAAYRALLGYDSARTRALSLRSWLYTIALNRVRNRSRSRKRAAAHEGEVASMSVLVAEDPSVSAERAQQIAALRRALATLALRYREAVVLRHLEGLSYGEIATLLAQPVGTAKANVHRGLLLLRQNVDLGEYQC
ncbi:MAG TPA: sigma-70 family RNA polymerase sigma factor [Candidatus Baltobacteraceae bacterium]